MKYDFDAIIDRKNTQSLKYDFAKERGMPEGILPLWVADMDFTVPEAVTGQLIHTARHAIFGYTEVKNEYFESVRHWFLQHFAFDPQPEWLVKTPGVVFAIAMGIRAFTEKGESVLIQEPVYYPFSETILLNERKLVNNQLVYANGQYRLDIDDFEKKIVENNVKLFILCNPHNPVGRVWSKDELLQMGEICLKHNCLIISDEIHCDFVHSGYSHHVFSTLSPLLMSRSVICTAPSKTFNLAGLQVSNIFIENRELRERFILEIQKAGYSQLNTMGLVACQSAYTHGGDWLQQLKRYLAGNLDFLRQFLAERLPMVQLVEPQATYLAWLDFSKLDLDDHALTALIVTKANLWLDDGLMFGRSGKGFQRMNYACPRGVLQIALRQLEEAIHGSNAC